jgi:hypothetical protein
MVQTHTPKTRLGRKAPRTYFEDSDECEVEAKAGSAVVNLSVEEDVVGGFNFLEPVDLEGIPEGLVHRMCGVAPLLRGLRVVYSA